MFWSFVQYLFIRRSGLARPILMVFAVVLLGCSVAGLIYVAVIFNAVQERSQDRHVITHHAH